MSASHSPGGQPPPYDDPSHSVTTVNLPPIAGRNQPSIQPYQQLNSQPQIPMNNFYPTQQAGLYQPYPHTYTQQFHPALQPQRNSTPGHGGNIPIPPSQGGPNKHNSQPYPGGAYMYQPQQMTVVYMADNQDQQAREEEEREVEMCFLSECCLVAGSYILNCILCWW